MAKPVEQMTPEEYIQHQAEIAKKEYSQMPPASPEQFKAQCERLSAERIRDWGEALEWFHETSVDILNDDQLCTYDLALRVSELKNQNGRTGSAIGKALIAVANALIARYENGKPKKKADIDSAAASWENVMIEIKTMLKLSREEYKAEIEQLKA